LQLTIVGNTQMKNIFRTRTGLLIYQSPSSRIKT